MQKEANIPKTDLERIVIAGGGFGGLELAKRLAGKKFQVVLIDRYNYHQFQPLFYQVATAGLEPASISFPLRKALQKKKNLLFRMASLERIVTEKNLIETDIGSIAYDHLVLATGVNTNYFGINSIERHAVPMKSVSEAIYLRNRILMNFEKALNETDEEQIRKLLTFVIVGGGPTGVELAGALAEMKRYILPKDYPDLDFSKMEIHLLEASNSLLSGMSEKAGKTSHTYLQKLGVKVVLNAKVTDYDGTIVKVAGKPKFTSDTLVWAAGVSGEHIPGLPDSFYSSQNRLKTNRQNLLPQIKNIYALGDIAVMETPKYPNGHPQVAQVAIQQAKLLVKNIERKRDEKPLLEFEFKNQGAMATIGRKLAVADLPGIKLKGFIAWLLWLFVHLMAMVGIKNRFFVFINWMWNYVLYDQSLRIMIRPRLFRYQQKLYDQK